MCKKYLLILVALFSLLPCYSEEDSSQDVLQQINSQAKLAQNIVVRLVESLNLREATLQKEQESLDSEKLEFQKEKDFFAKQKTEQSQTEQTLLNLDKSYQTLLTSQKRNETMLWCLSGVSVVSILTTVVVALVK